MEREVQKDVNMLCGIFPEGIADKAFPADSSAPPAVFYVIVSFIVNCSLSIVHCLKEAYI
ncbi:MAG: hypothetical protein GXP46_08080 [Deferribacteres bacterium]|nr:hypothetical protein [Deferribacteres bacterium]